MARFIAIPVAQGDAFISKGRIARFSLTVAETDLHLRRCFKECLAAHNFQPIATMRIDCGLFLTSFKWQMRNVK